MYTIQGKTGDWELVIGLEVHCEILSNSKVFSGASASFGAEQNTQVSFIDAAFPGMPVIIVVADVIEIISIVENADPD